MTSSSYISDSSDYVSSVMTDNTSFPSLTKSQKLKLNEILHLGARVSSFEVPKDAPEGATASGYELSPLDAVNAIDTPKEVTPPQVRRQYTTNTTTTILSTSSTNGKFYYTNANCGRVCTFSINCSQYQSSTK